MNANRNSQLVVACAAALALGFGLARPAEAGDHRWDHHRWGPWHGGRFYDAPRPGVVIAPAPFLVAPAPVVVAPPVVMAPPIVVVAPPVVALPSVGLFFGFR